MSNPIHGNTIEDAENEGMFSSLPQITMEQNDALRRIEARRCVAKAARPTLATLMNRHGTDKLFVHHYDGEYTRHFEPLRDKPIRLLEIGIGGYAAKGRGGESLWVWRDYFPNGQIVGLDIEDKSFCAGDRIAVHQGSQANDVVLTRLHDEAGPFDIIIDDGSHRQEHIKASFCTLFPLLRPGGIYVIEDLETAYREDYDGDPNPVGAIARDMDEPNTISLLADLIDGMHHRFWKGRTPTAIQRAVKSVHVSHELAFIYKADK